MATSIAKLAVTLTADTSQLQAGMNRAGTIVQRFSGNVQRAGQGVGVFGSPALTGNVVKMTGAINGLNGGFLNIAKGAGPLGLAIAALAGVMYKSAEAANELQRQNREVAKSYDEAFRALTGQAAQLPEFAKLPDPPDVTAWSKAMDTWTRTVGTAMSEVAGVFSTNLGDPFFNAFNKLFRTEAMDAEIAGLKRLEEGAKRLTEQAKAQEEAQRKADEAFRHRLDQLRAKADSLADSLRTPAEVFADTVAELRGLAGLDLISPETLTRGLAKAKADLLATVKIAQQLKTAAGIEPVAAALRNTQAAASAVSQSQANESRRVAFEKQSLEIEKEQRRLLEEANKIAREKKPVNLIKGNL